MDNGDKGIGLILTPTLVIGLGGTGNEVVRSLKRDLLRHSRSNGYETIPPIIRFLVIDTDSSSFDTRADEVELEDYERANIGGFDANEVIRARDFHKTIFGDRNGHEGWWDEARKGVGSVDEGSHQMRDVGRLALFVRYNEFKAKLEGQASLMKDRESIRQTRARTYVQDVRSDRVRIYIASSLCGGTGSGIFMDVSYIARSLFTGWETKVIALLALPSIFESLLRGEDQRARIAANTYAALLELEHISTPGNSAEWEKFSHYPMEDITISQKPFNRIFLIGIEDQSGKRLSNARHAYDVMAHRLYLDILYLQSEIDRRQSNILVDTLAGKALNGKYRLFNSFGISSRLFRRDIVFDYCARSLALDTACRLLEGAPEAGPRSFSLPESISSVRLFQELAGTVALERPDEAAFNQEGKFEAENVARLLQEVAEVGRSYEEDVRLRVEKEQLEEKAQNLKESLFQAMEEEVRSHIRRGGIQAGVEYIDFLAKAMGELREELREKLGRLRGEVKGAEEEYRRAVEELATLSEKVSRLRQALSPRDREQTRRRWREEIYRECLSLLHEVATKRLYLRYHQKALEIVEEVWFAFEKHGRRKRMAQLQRALQRRVRALRRVCQELLSETEGILSSLSSTDGSSGAIVEVLGRKGEELNFLAGEYEKTRDHFEEWYAAFLEGILEGITSGSSFARKEEAKEELLTFARARCYELSDILGNFSVCDQILEDEAIFQNMVEDCNPLWNFARGTSVEYDFNYIHLIVAEKGGRELYPLLKQYPDLFAEEDVIPTNDPNLFSVVRLAYGLPLFLLDKLPQYAHKYRSLKGSDVLHIHKGWSEETLGSPFPEGWLVMEH